MITHLLMGGDNVKARVYQGDLLVEGSDHMIAAFIKLRDKRLNKVKLYLASGIEIGLERTDGWEIKIRSESEHSQNLVIIRYNSGDGQKKQRQYLAANMTWVPYARGDSTLPENALRLPIFSP